MEDGSPSRRAWADEGEEEFLARGPEERLSLSDSEDYSSSDSDKSASPQAEGKGKQVVRKRHRKRRHRRGKARRVVEQGGFMAAARRLAAPRSPRSHPPCPRGDPDPEGFFRVCSRRVERRRSPPRSTRRRSPPRSPRPIPPELVGRCLRCLAYGHVKFNCREPERCYSCGEQEHRAVACPLALRDVGAKRPRSVWVSERRGALRRRPAPYVHCRGSADTVSGGSATTGGSVSNAAPFYCAPPTPRASSPPPPPPPPPHRRRRSPRLRAGLLEGMSLICRSPCSSCRARMSYRRPRHCWKGRLSSWSGGLGRKSPPAWSTLTSTPPSTSPETTLMCGGTNLRTLSLVSGTGRTGTGCWQRGRQVPCYL